MPLVGVFAAIWATALILILCVEFFALGDPRRGDTASEAVWWLRASPFVWALLPALTWVFLHWSMPWEPDRSRFNDLVYIMIGFALALWNVVYRKRKARR